jgi:hypothetical protein
MCNLLAAKIKIRLAASKISSRTPQRYRKALHAMLLTALAAGQIGCSALSKNSPAAPEGAAIPPPPPPPPAAASWLKSGSLALSRPVPIPTNRSTDKNRGATRARLKHPSEAPAPSEGSVSRDFILDSAAPRIIISRAERTITALAPVKAALSKAHSSADATANPPPLVFASEGAQNLKPGSFSITLKEEAPLWYAPTEYFIRRKMSVPEEGSRARFMRAALGNRALYLNDQTPIHSGPVWLGEIGGVQIKAPEMEQLFSLIPIGTRVEVR